MCFPSQTESCFKIRNRQHHLYHHICLCPSVWPYRNRIGQLLQQARSSSCRRSYLRDSRLLSDLNGHVNKSRGEYEEVYCKSRWGTRNAEGERLLDVAMFRNLVIGNTCFKKWLNQLITFTSCNANTQIMCPFVKPSASTWEISRLSMVKGSPRITIFLSVIHVLTYLPC